MSVCESIRYVELGQGELTVVFLHGLFGGPNNWRPIMEDLADEYRLLAPQFPIDHKSDRKPADCRTIHQLTDHVELFFEQVGLEKAVLCGNSLGGQVAIDFCLRDCRRIEQLVITGSAGLFERAISGGRHPRATREFIREKACEIFYDVRQVTDQIVDDVHAMLSDRPYVRFLIRLAKASRNCNMKEDLARLKLPTLIIWGENDMITPPFVAEEFREGISNAELVYIDRCGHAPPIEQPGEFSRILREFLEGALAACPARAVARKNGNSATTDGAVRKLLPR